MSVALRKCVFGIGRAGLLLLFGLCLSCLAHAASNEPDAWVGEAVPEYIVTAPRLPPEVAEDTKVQTATEVDVDIELESVPTAYVDSYLAEDDPLDFAAGQSSRQRQGRRTLAGELVYYDSSDGLFGGDIEQALRTRWRQETLNWGEFDAEIILSSIETNFQNRSFSNDEVYFTLRQVGAPLDNGWSMNSTAGHQRTFSDPFLHSGYRIRLPTSMFVGASSDLGTGTGTGADGIFQVTGNAIVTGTLDVTGRIART